MTNDNQLPEEKARALKMHNDLVESILAISADVPPHIVSAALLDALSHIYVTATEADMHQIAGLKRLGATTLDAFVAVAVTSYNVTGRAR